MQAKSDRKKAKGRLRKGWMDNVNNDLEKLGQRRGGQ